MVLKIKNAICLVIFLLAQASLFSKGTDKNDYAVTVISNVLRQSPEGIMIRNNELYMDALFSQEEKTWLPSVQIDLTANSNLIRGDYHYVRNRGISHGPQIIMAPSANIGIHQKLPGNGQIALDAGYGISCLMGQNAYIQQPYLQLGLSQNLSYGAFSLTKDPEIERMKNQKEMGNLQSMEAKFNLARKFISAVQDYNIALNEKEYYGIMLTKVKAEYLEESHRHQSGQRSNVELFNSHMNQTQALQNYQRAEQRLMEAESALASYKAAGIMEMSDLFRLEIQHLIDVHLIDVHLIDVHPIDVHPIDAHLIDAHLLDETYGDESSRTVQEQEILSKIKDEELLFKMDKSRLSPSLYMQASLSPGQNVGNEYTDLSRSIRELVASPDAWVLSGTVGLRLGLDFLSQGKILREVSDKKIQNLTLQLDIIRDEQKKTRDLYREWEESTSAYCERMENALREEEDFRKDMRTMLERNLITEAQFWGTELGYYETRLNYYRTVWSMIQGKLNILGLSSAWENFIGQFLEVKQ